MQVAAPSVPMVLSLSKLSNDLLYHWRYGPAGFGWTGCSCNWGEGTKTQFIHLFVRLKLTISVQVNGQTKSFEMTRLISGSLWSCERKKETPGRNKNDCFGWFENCFINFNWVVHQMAGQTNQTNLSPDEIKAQPKLKSRAGIPSLWTGWGWSSRPPIDQ